MLLSAPNVSEGSDPEAIEAIGAAFTSTGGVSLLDIHSDPDHNRSVFTLAGEPGRLSAALLEGAREAVARIDLNKHAGIHPHVGAIDVVPLVYLDAETRGPACAEALVAGDLIGRELDVPVLLYGALGDGRTRAQLRRGGPLGLAARIDSGELRPDFGPHRAPPDRGRHARRRAPAARRLQPRARAAGRRSRPRRRSPPPSARAGPEGLPGLRAIGLWLVARQRGAGVLQRRGSASGLRSPRSSRPPRRHAPVARAELVGLAPRAAFEGFPEDVPIPGFDPARHIIENALQQLGL